MTARTLALAAVFAVATATGAHAQVLGTFTWQMQPYCNRVTLTIVQHGPEYQLLGSDDQCGAGLAPATGSAVPTGSGVGMGFTIALPTGRVAHVSATVSLASVSGPWTDGDGNTGTFAFGTATGGATRPAPASTTAIVSSQLAPSIYGGTGAASTIARSDHTHDARYYTKTEVNTALGGKVDRPSGTGQVLIGPEALFPLSNADLVWVNDPFNGDLTTDGAPGGCFLAPVALPNGVTVTQLDAIVLDNAPGAAVNVQLLENPYGELPVPTHMATAISSGAVAGSRTFSNTSIASPDVDTTANTYMAFVCVGGIGTAFYGARVSFTYP